MDSLVVNVERGCEAAGRAKQLALAGRWGIKPPRFSRGGAELHCISAGQSGSIAAFAAAFAAAGPWTSRPPKAQAPFRGFPAIFLQHMEFNWAECLASTGLKQGSIHSLLEPHRLSSPSQKAPLSMFAQRMGPVLFRLSAPIFGSSKSED
jgi:hypothetical protein